MFMRRKDRRCGGDSPHEVFLRLRGQLLEVDPAELGLSPSPRLPRIWAMLMEMGLDTGTASLVAVADGTTSLYLSTGGGVIGGGEHQAVRRVSEAFLDTAEAHLDRLQPISEAPPPQTGAIRFHALTFDSLRSAEVEEGELVDGQSELASLFYAGNEVLTQLRLIDQRGQ
jgi:hypothetical protein